MNASSFFHLYHYYCPVLIGLIISIAIHVGRDFAKTYDSWRMLLLEQQLGKEIEAKFSHLGKLFKYEECTQY